MILIQSWCAGRYLRENVRNIQNFKFQQKILYPVHDNKSRPFIISRNVHIHTLIQLYTINKNNTHIQEKLPPQTTMSKRTQALSLKYFTRNKDLTWSNRCHGGGKGGTVVQLHLNPITTHVTHENRIRKLNRKSIPIVDRKSS